MAPNDLTPCRMAFYFVSTFAIAQTPTKQPALRLSRTKNLHFAKAPFPGFSAREYNKTKTALATLEQYEMFGHNMVDKCVENFRFLRKKGLTIRKTNDVIIATFCIENNLPLLFSDRDFIPFVDHLGLIPVSLKT